MIAPKRPALQAAFIGQGTIIDLAGLLWPMRSATNHNPYRREQRLRWRNRRAEWRARPDEFWFHGLTILALLLLGALLLWQAWPRLITLVAALYTRWPGASAFVVLLAIAHHQTLALQAQRKAWACDWLSAQPIGDALRRSILIRQTLLRASLHFSGVSVTLGATSVPRSTHWALLGIVMLGALLGWLAASAGAKANTVAQRSVSVFAPTGPGSFWTWQRSEALASLAPYRMARMLLLLLLVPIGRLDAMLFALGLVALAVTITAWSRSVSVLPAAQRWLAAQPLSAARLLRACAFFPMLILSLSITATTTLLLAADRASWCLPIMATVLLPASLHWACAAAERRRPKRIVMLYTLHLALMMVSVQALPILLLPLWGAQMLMLLYRALRNG